MYRSEKRSQPMRVTALTPRVFANGRLLLMVSLGIESADPALLARHKAGVELEEVRDTIARSRPTGCGPRGCS